MAKPLDWERVLIEGYEPLIDPVATLERIEVRGRDEHLDVAVLTP